MGHIKLCLLGAIKEARAFQQMDDEQMRLLINNANSVSTDYGFPTAEGAADAPGKLREYFQERDSNQVGLLEKLRDVEQTKEMSIKGITPLEFMHLVTSVQAGLREAIIYSSLSQEEIEHGIAIVNQMFQHWGIGSWDHYDKWNERWPEFFTGRAEILETILEAINQPYPGCEYPDFSS
ncbi:MAG: hypothetical protein AAGN35_15355 [Bacteroidota bacterium]